jgi:hypothetical protein
MNAQVDAVNLKITELEASFKEGTVGLIDAFNQYKGLESEKWWAEQSEKLENAKNATIDAFNRAGDWTKTQALAAKEAISKWFGEMGEKMSAAWASFKETVGQKWENFKGAISEFGDKIAEMWGNAMDSLGKLWDDLKIGAHDKYVDLKTGVLNLCTDMQCGVANLGIGMQKAGLAMDDAYQQVKGTISGAIGDKFDQSAGQLLVESREVTNQVIAKNKEFAAMDLTGEDPKTIASAQKHQASVLADLTEQQQELTSKMKARESVRDYMGEVTQGTKGKIEANVERRDDLNIKSQLNTDQSMAKKIDRSDKATQEKQSYADKVREARTASKGTGIGGK